MFDTAPAPRATPTALNESSRTYVRTLMAHVVGEQAWGVSAAAGSGWALRTAGCSATRPGCGGVNSVGQVTTSGHHYLVAVLSDGSTSMKDGVSLVERAARAAVFSATAH